MAGRAWCTTTTRALRGLQAEGHVDRVAQRLAGRLGMPEEVANLVSVFLSEKSSFMNSPCHLVDGGFTALRGGLDGSGAPHPVDEVRRHFCGRPDHRAS
ncbi:SDR family oxidoreductase [Micrococcus luteus]|nr:SDR family oxidoreductase [Micrococcus luteus]